MSGSAPAGNREPSVDRAPLAPVPSTIRGPLAGLADLAAALRDPGSAVSSFVRGLTVGILVGAGIVGSWLWRRRRVRP